MWLIVPSLNDKDVMVHQMMGLQPNKACEALFGENGFIGDERRKDCTTRGARP